MHDVDLPLDRDHVVAARAVHQVDERRDERPLPARARTGHEDDPFRLERQRLDLTREPELFGRDRTRRHQPEHAPRPSMIVEAHAPDAADALDVANPLGGPTRAERLVAALRDERQQERLDLACRVDRLVVERLQLSVDPHRRPRLG